MNSTTKQQTSAAHTPGPWEIQSYTSHFGYSIWAKGAGCIAERWYPSQQEEPYSSQIEANALLIAAAPAMLAALIKAEGNLSGFDMRADTTDEVRAAIAKALGVPGFQWGRVLSTTSTP